MKAVTNILRRRTQGGFTLLIALITVSIVLAISMSTMNIALTQFTLANTVRDAEYAFAAADAGLECLMYYDKKGGFFDINDPESSTYTVRFCDLGAPGNPIQNTNIDAFGSSVYYPTHNATYAFYLNREGGSSQTSNVDSEETLTYTFNAPARFSNLPQRCVIVSITKESAGVVGARDHTHIVSRGYNRPCSQIATDPRTVERSLEIRY